MHDVIRWTVEVHALCLQLRAQTGGLHVLDGWAPRLVVLLELVEVGRQFHLVYCCAVQPFGFTDYAGQSVALIIIFNFFTFGGHVRTYHLWSVEALVDPIWYLATISAATSRGRVT